MKADNDTFVKKDLEKEKLEQEKIANSLKKDKKQIAAEIKKKQQESNKIDAQIQKLIRDAIAEANRKTAAANAKANPKTTSAAETKAVESSTKIEILFLLYFLRTLLILVLKRQR